MMLSDAGVLVEVRVGAATFALALVGNKRTRWPLP
jgi:hypothetical protein